MKMRKRAVTLFLSLVMLLGLLSAGASAADLPFTDVSPDAWYYPGVSYAYNAKLMNGTGGTTFDPDGNTTRGMIVTMLHRMAGSPSVDRTGSAGNFTDVRDGDYFYDPVLWAVSNNIVTGYSDSTFRPNNTVTREEMSVFLYRYARLADQDMTAREDLSKFSDAGSVSSWAREEMSWAAASGLITGLSETLLGPGGSASRAQVATIFMRLDALIKGEPVTPEKPELPVKVTFEKKRENPYVSAVITAYDKNGGVMWTKQTGKYDLMLDNVSEMGLHGDMYYYVEDRAVIALDARTGEKLWENKDFGGADALCAMGDNAMYLCGYFGPDFYAISYDGKTLTKIDQFNTDYQWPFKMEISGNQAIVHMRSGPEGDSADFDFPFYVDLTNYTFKMGF